MYNLVFTGFKLAMVMVNRFSLGSEQTNASDCETGPLRLSKGVIRSRTLVILTT